ncbi:hypothetical protein F5876DRAFT_82626 [Lentinula aff. lateritia]|uniref:Uncharacterized protein n=1 Tax=Lentinula aff. lateritia TaxID=2804960 RepID=A0ACC1TJD4_9AGAR|nr:hypothetical protein F5876DRAFT_82626 [Lentinula aff. lateritia]
MDVDSIGEDLDPYVIAARLRIEEQQASLALANTNAPRLEDNSGSMTPTFSSDLFNAGTAPIMFTTDRGKELLNMRNLSPESVTQAEEFLRCPDTAENMFWLYSNVLQNQDMLRIMFKDSALKYKPTEDVKKTAIDYANLFLCSPTVFAYKHDSLPQKIVDAMREMKIPDLPPAHETGRCKVISAECGGALIHGRHAIKEKISASIGPKTDIAILVRQIIQGTKSRPTLALYIRIAFLRRVFIDTEDAKLKQEREAAEKASESTGVTLDNFWGIVDKKLESYRTQVPDTAIRFEVYKGIYDDDVKLFPRDSSLGADLVVHEKDVEPWILSIQARSQYLPS